MATIILEFKYLNRTRKLEKISKYGFELYSYRKEINILNIQVYYYIVLSVRKLGNKSKHKKN